MAIYKSEKYVWNSTTNTWDLYYDKTSADNIVETEGYKVLTASERNKISDYLSTFNVANKLVQLKEDGKIPSGLIEGDFTDYLRRDGSDSMTGDLDMGDKQIDNVEAINFASGGMLVDGAISTSKNQLVIYSELNLNQRKVVGLKDPEDPQDAANMRWVEQLVSQGTHIIAAVRAATTGNVASLSGLITVDGVALDEGDRVLVRLQTTPAENGVYIVNSGAWTKLPNDSDKGSLVSVLEGTTQRRHQYYNQDGTGWDLYWVDDDYHATVNGGLELDSSGLGFGIKAGGVTNAMLAGSIEASKIANQGSYDSAPWASMVSATSSGNLYSHIGNLYSAIRLLRGTANYNTNNTQTIADAYNKIALKNSVTYGTDFPDGNPGGADGDIYLRRLT